MAEEKESVKKDEREISKEEKLKNNRRRKIFPEEQDEIANKLAEKFSSESFTGKIKLEEICKEFVIKKNVALKCFNAAMQKAKKFVELDESLSESNPSDPGKPFVNARGAIIVGANAIKVACEKAEIEKSFPAKTKFKIYVKDNGIFLEQID
jgi:hypothetical protein